MNKRLINVNKLLGKTIAIYGLSKTGISAAKALGQRGIHIILWDENKDKIENAASLGFVVKNLHEADFSKIDYLIWSPGIPHTLPTPNPIALKAKEHNVPIVCDIEFFTSIFTNVKYIGITGTNGKSTTTGLTIGTDNINVIPTPIGNPFFIKLLVIGTIAHSHTGKSIPNLLDR